MAQQEVSLFSDQIAIRDEIEKWIKKFDIKIIYEIHKNNIVITYKSFQVKIHIPQNYDETLIIESINFENIWIDEVNIKCIEQNIPLESVLYYIYINIDIQTKCKFEPSVQFYMEKLKIESLPIKKSPLTCPQVDKRANKQTQLFSNESVRNIIITEYLNMWKENNPHIHIQLIDENIFTWNIKYVFFENPILNKELQQLENKFISVNISFHDNYYPNYPPMIDVEYPNLKNNLANRISTSKMVNLDYWTPTRDAKFIINRIYQILNNYASLNKEEIINIHKNDSELEKIINKLQVFIGITDDTDEIDKDYIFYKIQLNKQSSDVFSKQGRSGIGYSDGKLNWNYDEYIKLQNEKKIQIKYIFEQIKNIIIKQKTNNNHISNTIIQSNIIGFLIENLYDVSFFEMSNNKDLYMELLNFIEIIIKKNYTEILESKKNKICIYDVLFKLNEQIIKTLKLSPDYKDDLLTKSQYLYSLCEPYLKLKESIKDLTIETKSDKELYVKELDELKFDSANIIDSNYYHKKTYDTNISQPITYQKRLTQELQILQQSLTVNIDASIFFKYDERNMSVMRTLITGPPDTPYGHGCFIFDIYIPPTYPKNPPLVQLHNTGGVRFNPNLYECGKVCLSLINTWPTSNPSEKWNEKATLFQILMSINSLILIEEPYFNEPGYQRSYGTAQGTKNSNEYNQKRRLYTMKHAILNILKKPYPEFTDIIHKHFKIKKNRIIKTLDKWYEETTSNKEEYNDVRNQIIEQLNLL